ncbi:cadherin-like domain-containing protein [Limnohabitans sp. T6-5]|uniref:cadherin-like domain-containing protein n=1 Tax=Limnohabitans sp. T6-5 TaxID=1100724 RepID=UPI0011B283BF|nr:cadherin-like domain-containing protein [Limnohabitans sp. T6-5]
MRALIDEELASTAQARGIGAEQRYALEQEAAQSPSLTSSDNPLLANADANGSAKSTGFEWPELKMGEQGLTPFAVMGGGFLFSAMTMGGGPATIVAKAVLYANGIVADGYISGSIVKLIDANGKVIATTKTDASGHYTFDESLLKQASKVVASGGVDTSTGLKFEIELSAPSGATVINPLTTLVQSFIDANPGMSAANAMQAVRTALGIPDSQDLLTLDPIAAAMSGTAEQKSLALALQIKAAQVANLLITASSAMRASDPGLSIQDAMGKIISGLTKQIADVASGAQKPFALNDVSIITSVTGLSGDAVLLIAEGNTISADSLDGIYEFQKLVQDDLSHILSLGGTMSAEAFQSLKALLQFVSHGHKVVDFKLAPSSDTSLNGSALLTHVADPTVRIDLKPLADTVKVGDTIKLTQEGHEPTTVTVTPEDVARGYIDIHLPPFTKDGSATLTVVVTDSQTHEAVASGVVAITYDSHADALGAQIAPYADPVGGAGKPNVMITVTGLEAGAVWQYSLDNGVTWSAQISGNTAPVAAPLGSFVLTLRQIDKAGNESAASHINFEYSAGNFAPALTGAQAVLVDGVEDLSTTLKASDLLKGYSDAESQKLSIVNLIAKGDQGIEIKVTVNNDGTYTLTAPANYNGSVHLSYGVSDGVAVTAAHQLLNIKAVNDAAQISGTATGAVTEDAQTMTATGTLVISDVDTGESAVLVQTQVAGIYGSFSIGADGKWTYTLDNAKSAVQALAKDATVTDTFAVISKDGTATQNVVITITGTNDAAQISGASTSTLNETDAALTATGTLTATDVDGTANLFQAQTNVAGNHGYGTFSVSSAGVWTYSMGSAHNEFVAGTDYTDSITVKAADGTEQVVTVTITGTNDAPALTSLPAILSAGVEDTAYTFTVAQLLQGYSDVDGGTLSVTNLTAEHGTLTDDGKGTYTFTPDANYNGPVALSYTINDGQGGHTAVEQSFSLSASNDAAALTGSKASLAAGTEDQSYIIRAADLLTGYSDADLGTLRVTELLADHGQITDNHDGTYTFTPTANYNGAVTLSYIIADGQGGHTAATQTLSLDSVNDAPALNGEAADLINGQEGQAYEVSAADLLKGYSDVEGDALSVAALSANHGSVTDNGDGTYTITPDAGYAGLVTLNYKVVDANGAETAASQSFGLSANNVAPALTGTATHLAAGQEDSTYTVSVQDLLTGYSDQDGGTLAVENLRVDHGQVQLTAPGVYTITPDANYNGTLTLSYKVVDGQGGRTHATQTVTLDSVNDAPALTSLPAILAAGSEDQAYQVSAAQLLQGFSDVDGGTLSVGALSADHGTVTDNGDGTFTITPASNYNGAVTLSYQVRDGQGGDTSASQSFSLNSVNDAPALTSLPAILSAGVEDTAYTFTVAQLLQGYSDVDGGTLSVTNLTAEHGTLTDDGHGNYSFTPDANYYGPVALSYTINDGQGGHTAVEQSFSLSAVNDAPRLVADTLRITEGASQSSYNLLTNDSDVEGSILSISGISNASQDAVSFDAASNTYRIVTSHGVLTLGVNGSYSYEATGAASVALNAGEKFTETFTYTVFDGETTSTSTLKVTIDGASTVIDGYVQNATVFYDLNNNLIQDEGEATATTDALGRYSVSVDTPLSGGRWVSTGGTDAFSGEVVGYLFAPAGSSVITPLTTLLAFGPDAQRAAIETSMLKVLGLDTLLADAGISSVTDFDPMAAIVSPMDGASLSALQQAGAAVFAAQQVMMTLMQTAIKLGSAGSVVQDIQSSFAHLASEISLGHMADAATAEGRMALLHALNEEVISSIVAHSASIPDALKSAMTQAVSDMLDHVTDALVKNFEALAVRLANSAHGLELSVDDQIYIALAKSTVAAAQTSLLNAISNVLHSERPLQAAASFATSFDAQIQIAANDGVTLPAPPGDSLSIAAAKAYIAQGFDVSGHSLTAPSISLSDFQALHTAAGLRVQDGVEINVDDLGVPGYSDEINSLLGETGLHAVLNLGGNVNETVTIDQTQAMGLIHAGLDFAAGDTITLNVDTHSAAGTHLSNSLKDLSKLGVDAIQVNGDHINVDLGTGAFGENGAGGANFQLPGLFGDLNGDHVLSDAENAALSVTLNAATGDVAGIAHMADALSAMGIDHINLGGSDNVSVSIDQVEANALIHAGLDFAAGDTITLNVDTGASGTHLSNSLKDLSKLGVDAIQVNGDHINVDLGTGAFGENGAGGANFQLPGLFGDLNGDHVLSDAENAALSVTLNAATGDVAGIAHMADALLAMGIDHINLGGSENVSVSIDQVEANALIHAGLDFAAGDTITLNVDTGASGTHLSNSLKDLSKLGVDAIQVNGDHINVDLGTGAFGENGAGGANFQLPGLFGDLNGDHVLSDAENAALSVTLNAATGDVAGIAHMADALLAMGIDHINLGGSENVSVSIDQVEANALIHAGLDFAAGDTITLNVDTGASGTHLSNSLKDLSKLGVDAIQVNGDHINVDLGAGAFGENGAGGANFQLPGLFGDLNGDHVLSDAENAALSVTLNAATGDVAGIAHMADALSAMGIDHINLGGSENVSVSIDQVEANALIHAGLDFAAGDTITLNVDTGASGTHLSNSLKDLSKLGVDAIQVNGDHINVDLGAGAFGENGAGGANFQLPGLFGDLNGDHVLSDAENAALSVTLNAATGDVAGIAHMADALSAMGIDHINLGGSENVSVSIDQVEANALIHAGLDFAAGDTITLNVDTGASGTHLSNSLKDLSKLGVDAIQVNGDHINVDLGTGAFGENGAGGANFNLPGLFGDLNGDHQLSAEENAALSVTLNASADDVAGIAHMANALSAMGIDHINLGGSDNVSVSIDQVEANALIHAGLDFAAGDVITLNVDTGASGTHLSNSLKDLSKLGVDAIQVNGDHINVDLGAGAFGENGAGGANFQLPGLFGDLNGDHVLSDAENAALSVTLNAATGDVAGIAHMADALSAMGIDHINLGGSDNVSVSIDQVEANALIHAGLDFAAGDTITLNVDTGASGTHLSNSLKDLSKLGVDAIQVNGDHINLDLGAGAFGQNGTGGANFQLPGLFGDLNGDHVLSAEENAALSVTLNASAGDVAGLAHMANALSAMGIDHINLGGTENVSVSIDQVEANALIHAGLDFAAGDVITLNVDTAASGTHLSNSLKDLSKLGVDAIQVNGDHINVDLGAGAFGENGAGGANFQLPGLFGDLNGDHVLSDAENAALSVTLNAATGDVAGIAHMADALSAMGIDHINLGGSDNVSVSIDQVEANALIHAGLDFAAGDTITLNVDTGASGTHLSNSLKDLSKLGVDAIQVNGDHINLDLGAGAFGQNGTGGANFQLPGLFGDLNGDHVLSAEENAALSVTLNASAGDVAGLAHMANALSAMGIDHINLGGTENVSVSIDQVEANALIHAGLDFAAGDTITLNVDTAASGTHLSNSLKDLSKLGVDAIQVNGDHINVDLGAGAFGQNGAGGANFQLPGLFGDLNGDHVLSAEENAALSVTLNAQATDVAGLAHMADALSAMGIDHINLGGSDNVSVSIDQVEANALIHAGLDFAAGDVITLNVDTAASGTHLSNSLKDLSKLGVDAIQVNGDHINVDLGTGAFGENGAGGANFQLPGLFGDLNGDHVLSAEENAALSVTLNASADDVAGLAHMANALSAMGIDHINLGGSENVSVSIDQVEANALIHAGLDFAAGDTITLNVDTGASGTHLSNSLKDLSKLGVDAIQVTGGDHINVDLGAGAFGENGAGGANFNLPGLFGDLNGDHVLSERENAALSVTLNASADDVAGIAHMANALSAMGIDHINLGGSDNVSVSIDQVEANALIHAGLDFAAGDTITLNVDTAASGTHLSNSLKDLSKLGVDAIQVTGGDHINVDLGAGAFGENGAGGANFQLPGLFGDLNGDHFLSDAENAALSVTLNAQEGDVAGIAHMADALSAMGIDHINLGGSENVSVSIDQVEANALIHAGLDFAAGDTITLNVDTAASGTHLSNSLKDLSKLGVDAIQVTGGDHINVDLGAGAFGENGAGGANFQLPGLFGDLNGDHVLSAEENAALSVTLNASANDVAGLAHMAGALSAMGIDHINLGGSDNVSVSIDQVEANALIHAGLDFAAGDVITLNVDTAASGTHLSNSLKDLSKLGVDAIQVNGDHINVDLGAGAFGENGAGGANFQLPGLFGDLNGDHVLSAEENAALSVTLNAQATDVAGLAHMADALSAMGIDHINLGGSENVSVSIDQVEANALIHAGLDFAAGDTITLNVDTAASGTHLSNSLKDLSKLGVDAIQVTGGDHINVDLGTGAFGQNGTGGANFQLPGLFGDLNGDHVLSAEENAALSVTLNASADDVAGIAHMANALSAMGIDHINLGGSDNVSVSIDQVEANALIHAGLDFAMADAIDFHASGTHLSTSLKDLQKLGVDTVTTQHGAVNLELGDHGVLTSGSLPHFDTQLDVTLNLADQSLNDISPVAQALADAGIDHITLSQGQLGDLTSDAATFALINAGIDFNVIVDSVPAYARGMTTLDDVVNIMNNGVDILHGMLESDASMGDLIRSLQDAGVRSIELATPDLVTVGDDLASALHAAGMLEALPQAGVEIDAVAADHMQTTFKALAELGVDHVLTSQISPVHVDAGTSNVSDLVDLIGHFASDSVPGTTKAIFDHGAELDFGQISASDVQTLQQILENGVSDQLAQLGVTKVVAQYVLPPVEFLGGSEQQVDVFAMDIVKKSV